MARNMKSNLCELEPSAEKASQSDLGNLPGKFDVPNIMQLLNMTDGEKLHEERFHVDRMKLEAMFKEESKLELSSLFFNKIMKETHTYIVWPDKIRTGAKTKKDPFVQVSGRLNDVKVAKDKILLRLEPVNNRVTMKLDVSYTVHSHIIGLGGKSIKTVMEKTQCHIHFPDSNRSNSSEKSNQVSIVGELAGVEKARKAIRNLVPLLFCFEIPNISCLEPQPDVNNPFIMCISQKYDVQVIFRNRTKFNAILVLVKGSETEVQKVKEATVQLIAFFSESGSAPDCGTKNQNLVQMTMEITSFHHPFVRGENNVYLKTIMKNTNTLISFPETNDSNIPMIKRSNVTITGSIDNVYIARQQLIGSLPLVIIFDWPEKLGNIKPEKITELMSSLDVFISFRNKPKQTSYSVIIKGTERNASNIYEARRQILGLNEPKIIAKVPSTYHLSTSPIAPISPIVLSSKSPPLNNNIPATSTLIWNDYKNPMKIPNSNCVVPFNSPTDNKYGNLEPFHSQFPEYKLFPTPVMAQNSSANHNDTVQFPRPKSSASNSSGNQTYYGLLNYDSGFVSMNNSPMASPPSRSPIPASVLDTYLERKYNKTPSIPSKPTAYPSHSVSRKQLQLVANQALQNINLDNYRIPNPVWAGLGFSGTSPSALERHSVKEQKKSSNTKDDSYSSPTSTTNINTSCYGDYLTEDSINDIRAGQWRDLNSLLIKVGLERYINVFDSYEIDLAVFKTLDDKDLLDIGITTLGARRKILLIISELNRYRHRGFLRAPGGERFN